MTDTTTEAVIATPKPEGGETKGALQRKWGALIIKAGFTGVPDILLRRMGKLGLKPMEMIVLLQILTYWWDRDQLPYPSRQSIADAIGCDEKTVQRAIGRLHKTGFIKRVERRRSADRSQTNIYDFSPLIAMLEPEAKEEVQRIEEAMAAKAAKRERMRHRGRTPLVSIK